MRLFRSGRSKCLPRARACSCSSASSCLSCTGPSGASEFRSLRGSLSLALNEVQKLFSRARLERPRPPVTSRQVAKQISFAGHLPDRAPSALFASRLTKLSRLMILQKIWAGYWIDHDAGRPEATRVRPRLQRLAVAEGSRLSTSAGLRAGLTVP